MKSHKAMEAEQLNSGSSADAPAAADESGDDDVVMYRGRPVRRGGNGPRVPGAGSVGGATGYRGAGTSSGKQGKGTPDIKAVLKRLDELHREGLITKSEYNKKRLQILDRL